MISTAEVLESIEPADPDQLNAIDPANHIFEAQWSTVNRNDVDLQRLRKHPNCQFIGTPYEPDDLPGWTAVTFRWS